MSGALEGITQLGDPLYLVTFLGVWKMLGGVALVAPRLPRLEEWRAAA